MCDFHGRCTLLSVPCMATWGSHLNCDMKERHGTLCGHLQETESRARPLNLVNVVSPAQIDDFSYLIVELGLDHGLIIWWKNLGSSAT